MMNKDLVLTWAAHGRLARGAAECTATFIGPAVRRQACPMLTLLIVAALSAGRGLATEDSEEKRISFV